MTNFKSPNYDGPSIQPANPVAEQADFDALQIEQPQLAATELAAPGWMRRHKFALSLGLMAAGAAASFAMGQGEEVKDAVVNSGPEIGIAWGATEVAWQIGAGMSLLGSGLKIGNPLTLKGRWQETMKDAVNSPITKVGLAINTAGAIGAAGVYIAAASKLPVETWPGAAGFIGLDIASTIALRAPFIAAMTRDEKVIKHEVAKPTIKVRKARLDDIDRLADIDILLFDKAYGANVPDKSQVVDMLTQRYQNNPDWMFVTEINGEVEGFVSAFLTNKPIEKFVSWEDSTNDGTLNGKIDPAGNYVYVTNMTIKHEAVEHGAREMLLAHLFAQGIANGVQYGYFVSRMPYFRRYAEANNIAISNNPDLEKEAIAYFNLRNSDGGRYDKQLRDYENDNFKLIRLVGGGFDDEASLGYGVVCQADCPPYKDILRKEPILWVVSHALRRIAKHPKLLRKIL